MTRLQHAILEALAESRIALSVSDLWPPVALVDWLGAYHKHTPGVQAIRACLNRMWEKRWVSRSLAGPKPFTWGIHQDGLDALNEWNARHA